MYEAKDHPTFYSGRHKSWTNPNLTFISPDIAPKCQRVVFDKFPRSRVESTLFILPQLHMNFCIANMLCPILVRCDVGIKINSLNWYDLGDVVQKTLEL